MTNKQKILGLDFDGTISDSRKAKMKLAKELWHINLPIEATKKEQAVKSGLLNAEQYEKLVCEIYETERGMEIEVMDGFAEVLEGLMKNFEVRVLTSRSPQGVFMAKKWVDKYSLPLPIIGTNDKEKTNEVANFWAYLDDDLYKLKPLVGIVPNLFWFNSEGRETELPIGIKEVRSWKELATTLGNSQ